MAKNVFISFRYSDGHVYKEDLSSRFDRHYDTVDFSEDVNRSGMSDSTIQKYLYGKLRRSSVTIVLITPEAVNHRKDWYGYNDWMYDEIRYSLENRENNQTNGIVAVYTPEAAQYLIERSEESKIIKNVDNLFRANMMNVKSQYKKNPKPNIYDSMMDSYCSLVAYSDFISDISYYIDNALEKRKEKYKYDICCRL